MNAGRLKDKLLEYGLLDPARYADGRLACGLDAGRGRPSQRANTNRRSVGFWLRSVKILRESPNHDD
jgi:hypothetical protein